MKNVYFVQANSIYGTVRKSVYIPYAVGCIQAYCMQDPVVARNYRFGRIVYWRMPVDEAVASMEDPYMVLFSCSVWNTEYNKALARAVKKAYPECRITFGGHNISADGETLRAFGFVDYLTHRFGEEPTAGLLRALAEGTSPADVPNISFRGPGGEIVTTRNQPQTGADYPSPYLAGVFDDLFSDDLEFSVLFETNRGCPYRCAYCDWSSLKSKVRLFPMERIRAEIDWFVAHKIEFIFCPDANFCLLSRDADIVDYIVKNKKKYGYPKLFRVCFTKNRFDFVFDIGSKLVKNGLDKAMTLSFQSMNEEVLSNVGRKNISTEEFRKLMNRYSENQISTYSELIIGLPGETYESFCRGIGELFENGQHFCVNTYPCELLPNSEMGQKQYIEKYRIRSARIPYKVIHSDINEEKDNITEYADYVISTCSMNEDAWVRCLLFAYFVQGLHNLGLLRAVAIWCRYALGVGYTDFYQKLLRVSAGRPDSILGRLYARVYGLCRGVLDKTNALVAPCEDTEGILWGFDEILCLEAYRDYRGFLAEVHAWVVAEFGESEVLDPLFRYQYDIIKKIGPDEVEIRSDYDFYTYFNRIFMNDPQPLLRRPIRLHIRDDAPVRSFAQFARETVWYGRNRRETDYTSSHYRVETLDPAGE